MSGVIKLLAALLSSFLATGTGHAPVARPASVRTYSLLWYGEMVRWRVAVDPDGYSDGMLGEVPGAVASDCEHVTARYSCLATAFESAFSGVPFQRGPCSSVQVGYGVRPILSDAATWWVRVGPCGGWESR